MVLAACSTAVVCFSVSLCVCFFCSAVGRLLRRVICCLAVCPAKVLLF